MRALGIFVLDSWADALARKASLVVGLLIAVPLVLIAVALPVELGSTPGTVRITSPWMIFLEEPGGPRPIDRELPVEEFVRVVNTFVVAFLSGWGILMALFLTAGLLPRTLGKGQAEIVLSKPIPRWSVYLGRYFGAVTLFLGASLVVILAVAGILWGRTGFFSARAVLSVLLVNLVFAALYAWTCLVGLVCERSGLAVLGAVLVWLLCGFLGRVHTFYPDIAASPKLWVRLLGGVGEALYRVLPRTEDLAKAAREVLWGQGLGWTEPIWATALSTLTLLSLSVLWFYRRDY